jgi:hypothetical protein
MTSRFLLRRPRRSRPARPLSRVIEMSPTFFCVRHRALADAGNFLSAHIDCARLLIIRQAKWVFDIILFPLVYCLGFFCERAEPCRSRKLAMAIPATFPPPATAKSFDPNPSVLRRGAMMVGDFGCNWSNFQLRRSSAYFAVPPVPCDPLASRLGFVLSSRLFPAIYLLLFGRFRGRIILCNGLRLQSFGGRQ